MCVPKGNDISTRKGELWVSLRAVVLVEVLLTCRQWHRAPCQHCTPIHKGTYVSLKNPTIGQRRWKLDARYSELIWKLVSIYSFIISDLSERLGALLWPHDSHRHHLSGALTGFCVLIPSSYWQNVNFIFISQKTLALGLLFNPSLLYCEVEKNFLL